MPIPTDVIGREFASAEVALERGRMRLFAITIGETDPVYFDVDSARAAGHRDLPALPTFLFSLELDLPDPFGYLDELGVDLRRVLHGGQSFTYHATAHAGDTLTVHARIADVYSKKGGALDFVVKQTTVSRADGTVVAELESTIVVQNLPPGDGSEQAKEAVA